MGAKEPNLKDNTPRNSRQLWTWVCNPLGSGLFRNCRWWYQTRTRKSISTPLDLFLKLSHQMICRCAVGGWSACEKYRFTTSRVSHDYLFINCKLFGATSPCHIHFPSRWVIELVSPNNQNGIRLPVTKRLCEIPAATSTITLSSGGEKGSTGCAGPKNLPGPLI